MKINSKFLGLLGVSLVAFVSLLDYTIVNTALPTIQQKFQVSILSLQWVFNIYCIIVSIFMIINGRLGDIYGRRLVFYIGSIILGLGSLGAGLSTTFESLIFFRAIQSLGVAATVPLGVSLVNSLYQENAHHAMSFYAAITGIALAIGPALGGWLVVHWGWQWIFYINIPLLIIAFCFSLPSLPEFKSSEKIKLDFKGFILLAITIGSFIYALIHGEEVGWVNYMTLILFFIAFIACLMLIKTEKKQGEPLINFAFFHHPQFSLAAIGCIAAGLLISPALFFSPLFLQQILDFTPKTAGFFLLMVPIAIVFFSPLIGKLTGKIGPKNILFIGILLGFITTLFYLLFKKEEFFIISVAFFLTGVVWAFINVGAGVGAGSSVEPSKAGVAVGTVFSLWNISSAIAIAVTSVLFHIENSTHELAGNTIQFLKGFELSFIFVAFTIAALFIFAWKNLISKK